MYAIKGNWVGQTFALATAASDSSGKKSRVRLSKEERKSMVETFIKRHQSSNNGSFPSLNLTHKEVGGSFYTVRKLVREIIQENRVLGPPQDPLGSIALEPEVSVFHTRVEQKNVFDDVCNQLEVKIMELNLDNEEHYINDQDMNSFQSASEDEIDKIDEDLDSKDVPFSKHEDSEVLLIGSKASLAENETSLAGFADGNKINGIFDTNKLPATGPLLSHIVETNEELSAIGERKAHIRLPTEEIVVETFPLKQVNGEVVEHTDCNRINEASDFTKSPEIKEDIVVLHDHIEQISPHNAIKSKTAERHDHQSKNAPKGTSSLDSRSNKNNNKEPPFLVVSGNNNRRDDKALAASSPPVDRINLQSWEKAAVKQQPNPLLAIFKAFADALVKFWS